MRCTDTDGALLAEFAQNHADAAFAELVRRHGGMVVNACLRLLGNRHDAEDAAQAVFLVLAAKAGTLTGSVSVAGWLHQVALNVARNARRASVVRGSREYEAAMYASANASNSLDPWRRLAPVLDDELGALPEKYRKALILFHLEGRPLDECAKLSGCKPGALGMRLARGRELLRDRLSRRDAALPVALMVTLLTEHALDAGVSDVFISAAAKSAALFAAGSSTSVIAPHVAALSKGAMHMLFISQLKAAAAVLAALVVISAGTAAIATSSSAVDEVPQQMPLPLETGPVVKNGLAMSFISSKEVYIVGEPIEFTVRLQNVSEKTLALYDVAYSHNYLLTLDPPWRPVYQYSLNRQSATTSTQLKPGEHIDIRLLGPEPVRFEWDGEQSAKPKPLDHLPCGSYHAMAAISVGHDKAREVTKNIAVSKSKEWLGEIASAPISFEVVEPTNAVENDGLSMAVTPTKRAFEADELPRFTIMYHNVSGHPLLLSDLDYTGTYQTSFMTDDGGWTLIPTFKDKRAIGEQILILAGAKKFVTLSYDERYKFSWRGEQARTPLAGLPPGTYRSTCRATIYRNPGFQQQLGEQLGRHWSGEIVTQPVEVVVREPAIASAIHDGLSITLKPQKAIFRAGEELSFKVTLANLSDQRLALYDGAYPLNFQLELDPPWRPFLMAKITRERPVWCALNAGQKIEIALTYDLNYSFDWTGPQQESISRSPSLPPGKYHANCRLKLLHPPGDNSSAVIVAPPHGNDMGIGRVWTGEITSGPVEFTIAEP
jgi:RNA polymerase sigma factor (sigma-70 family)